MDTIVYKRQVDMGSIPVRDTRKTGIKHGLFSFLKDKHARKVAAWNVA